MDNNSHTQNQWPSWFHVSGWTENGVTIDPYFNSRLTKNTFLNKFTRVLFGTAGSLKACLDYGMEGGHLPFSVLFFDHISQHFLDPIACGRTTTFMGLMIWSYTVTVVLTIWELGLRQQFVGNDLLSLNKKIRQPHPWAQASISTSLAGHLPINFTLAVVGQTTLLQRPS